MEKSSSFFKLFKLLFGIGLCLLFVVLGIWLFTVKANAQTAVAPWIIKTIGVINVVFFGTFFIFSIKKLLSNKKAQ